MDKLEKIKERYENLVDEIEQLRKEKEWLLKCYAVEIHLYAGCHLDITKAEILDNMQQALREK